MTIEQIKEVEEQINHLEIQRGIVECKEFLDSDDHSYIRDIDLEIRKLKEKLNA